MFFTHWNELSTVMELSFWFSFGTDFCCFLVKAAVICVPLLEQPPTLIVAVCLVVLALVLHRSHRKINTHSLSCALKGSLYTCSCVLFMAFAVLISFCSGAFVIWSWLFLVVVCVVIDLNANTLVV